MTGCEGGGRGEDVRLEVGEDVRVLRVLGSAGERPRQAEVNIDVLVTHSSSAVRTACVIHQKYTGISQ